jgi:CheY-like chemotaxis protein
MHLNGKTILLVIHDIRHRSQVACHLHELGYDLVTAENGALGVLAAHSERPALVIAESEMPIMNGYQLVETLRSDPATEALPVILLVPVVDDAAIARCWAHGADLCLPKASGLAELLLTVDRTVGIPAPAGYQTSSAYAA